MFLLGWMIDGVLTVIGCIILACAFGNSPITFLFFFVFPIVFILIWCKIFEKTIDKQQVVCYYNYRKRGTKYETISIRNLRQQNYTRALV